MNGVHQNLGENCDTNSLRRFSKFIRKSKLCTLWGWEAITNCRCRLKFWRTYMNHYCRSNALVGSQLGVKLTLQFKYVFVNKKVCLITPLSYVRERVKLLLEQYWTSMQTYPKGLNHSFLS